MIVNLVASTTTTKGLRVRAALDADAAMAALHLTPDKFDGDWNYAIAPAESPRIRKQCRVLRETL